MGRYTISAMIIVDVNGEDEVEAFENFADAIEDASNGDHIRDITVQHSETKQVPFVVPAGAQRWGAAAEKIRFSDEEKRAAMHDGSWWWTDGHVALRCEGEVPDGYRRIENAFAKPGSLPEKPRATTWGMAVVSTDGRSTPAVLASADQEIAIQEKYRKLVEDSAPEVRWMLGTKYQPAMAMLGDTCVAYVMPFRADRLVVPAQAKSVEQEKKA